MYDWNGNGKHDAFDDAMFMALLEDDLERHPPGKKSTVRKSSSSSEGSMGCTFYLIFLIFAPLYTAFEFLMMGEGGIALFVIMLAVALNIIIPIVLFGQPANKTAAPAQSQTNAYNAPVSRKEEIDSQEVVRIGYYDVVIQKDNTLILKKFLGVDKAVQEIPSELNGMPFRVIAPEAFYNCRYIEKMILPEGIEELCDDAFKKCDLLQEAVIPKSVKKIGKNAFPKGKNTLLYCYSGSYGLEFARKNQYRYKRAEDIEKQAYSYTSRCYKQPDTTSYIPLYSSGLLCDSLDDEEEADVETEFYTEPEETVRERLDYDLAGTGYDSYELEWMDEEERDAILEENGLDPYDYDFDDMD